MRHLSRILCPVDLSAATPFGLSIAAALAHEFGASLHLVHVLPNLPLPVRVPLDADAVYSRWGRDAQERLDVLVTDLRGRSVATTATLARGVAFQAILVAAEEHDADLILMPTHGRAGLDRLMTGSVAEAVLRASLRPVLAVPPAMEARAGFRPRRILMATDFSDSAETALQTALEWARHFAAHLVVGHVFTWQQIGQHGPEWFMPTFTHDQVERAIAQTTQRLDEIAARAARAGVLASTDLSQGANPAREIIRLAKEEDVDLLVVASHGHGVVKRAMLGSTVAKLARSCQRPFLTVPPGDETLAGEHLEAVNPAGC